VKARLLLPTLICGCFFLAAAGCGGSGDGDGGSDLASVAPAGSPIFVEGAVRPKDELQSNVEAVARTLGVDDLGELIVFELEDTAREHDEPFDFETDMEPWLGEEGGVFLTRFDGEDFEGNGVVVEVTDVDAAQQYIDQKVKSAGGRPPEDASYRGVDYKIETGEGEAIGLIGDLMVGGDVKAFREAVDASEGDSLADESAYRDTIANATDGSLADVYVDVGLLIEQAGDEIDESALEAFEGAGIEPREATAVASIVPGADRVEIEVSSDLGDQEAPSGDASELLGSLPGDSFAAFATTGFGEQLGKALDELDKAGIPGEVPPGELKKGVSELGFDLDKVADSFEDAGLFASGTGEGNIGGAFVLTTDDSGEVATAVKTISALVRQSGDADVTAVTGKASGFSVRDPEELGPQPLVVATKADRVAIGYGLRQTLQALDVGGGSSLSGAPDYEAAVAALGDTPISGFVDGPGALRLADSFVPASETGFEEAKPYLDHVRFIAIGSRSDGNQATAKLIVGLEG
jgi:Protein of unknown function (DUF3352)